MRSLIIRLHAIYRNKLINMRGFLFTQYLRLHGCKVGKGLRVQRWPLVKSVLGRNLEIGDNVSLGTNIVLQTIGEGKIILDDRVKLIHDVFISASERVYIGKDSGVAERCSIRDAEHGTNAGTPMYDQPLAITPVFIGNDVQISLGSAVLAGAHIEDGVIIGAGSIVTRNLKTVRNGIYFGTPPRLIGKRP